MSKVLSVIRCCNGLKGELLIELCTEPHLKAVPRLCDYPTGCGGEFMQPRNRLIVKLCTLRF